MMGVRSLQEEGLVIGDLTITYSIFQGRIEIGVRPAMRNTESQGGREGGGGGGGGLYASGPIRRGYQVRGGGSFHPPPPPPPPPPPAYAHVPVLPSTVGMAVQNFGGGGGGAGPGEGVASQQCPSPPGSF